VSDVVKLLEEVNDRVFEIDFVAEIVEVEERERVPETDPVRESVLVIVFDFVEEGVDENVFVDVKDCNDGVNVLDFVSEVVFVVVVVGVAVAVKDWSVAEIDLDVVAVTVFVRVAVRTKGGSISPSQFPGFSKSPRMTCMEVPSDAKMTDPEEVDDWFVVAETPIALKRVSFGVL